jgi:hypothetical protein
MAMPEPGQIHPSSEAPEGDLLSELDQLEEKILQITRTTERLREDRRSLEGECQRLRSERSLTVGRLSQLIRKVDALREES